MTSRLFPCTLCLLSLTLVEAGSAPQAPRGPAPVQVAGLAKVFQRAGMLQDRNDDGRIDFVNARIVLPDDPATDDIAAASAVSARLGFETTGMTLPLVARSSEVNASDKRPLILIGANQPRVPASINARLKTLKPGQGLAAWTDGSVVIAGPTPVGTRIAAEAFAGRSPYLWEITGRDTGETFDRVAADLGGLLRSSAIAIRQISFDEMVFERNRDEAVSATVTADVERGTAARGRRAVEALKDRHLRGQDTDKLNYSGVVDLVIKLNDGQSIETVTLTRVDLPARLLAPGRDERPEARATRRAKSFDLSDVFTPAGLLADTNGDRIPDNTETVIVLPADGRARSTWRGASHLAARLGLEAGSVHVNETSSSRVDLMPYGGTKDSGFGREGPKYAIREMTEERLVTITLTQPT